MKLKYYIWVLLVVPMFLSACKRDHNFNDDDNGDDPKGSSVNIVDAKDLIVPESFNFETSKNLWVRVKVANQSYEGERFRINIYIDEPSTGKLTVAGMTDLTGEFSANVRVASDIEYIYIEKVDEQGNRTAEKVRTNKFTSTIFNNDNKNTFVFKSSSGLDCNSGCTNTYNNHTGNITVNSGEIACVTGAFSGNIYINGTGVLKYCGTGTVDSLVLNNTARAFILDDAVVTIGTIVSNNSTTEFTNWSDSLVSNHCHTSNSKSENHGKFYIQCSFNLSSTGNFTNYGEMYITGHIENEGVLKNYHYITVNDYLTVASGATLNNYCNLTVKATLTVDGTLTSNTYVKAQGQTTISSSGKIQLQSGAYLSTSNLTNNGILQGTGANSSIVKVSSTSTLNTGSNITGKISYCDNNGIETNNGTMASSAQLSCSGYIPTGNCNPEGFGTFTVPDADNDGVADVLDEYPNDPSRAFNSFYPCATTCSNFAFEDLWPAMGDFDFNDHVVAYNVQKVYSPDYSIVDFKVKMKPRAIGAGYDNGLAFSLDDVPASSVSSVSGTILSHNFIDRNANGTEAGQSKAVIIIYDSPEPLLQRGGGSMFNTIQANPRGYSDTAYISVTFTSALSDSLVPFQEFNPFIFTNKRRGYEIHLPNHKPTDLADMSLFGTQADASVPSSGRYYKTSQGLPWAIEIPENFNYPQEKKSVLVTYNYFDDWAMSGGKSYPNWFRNFGAYTNASHIFKY